MKPARALALSAATAVAVCALATGCTATVSGTVTTAPTLGRAPKPLPDSALPGLLLSASDIGSIMGTGMNVVETSDSLYANQPLAGGCLVWSEAQQANYKGSGWTAVHVAHLSDRTDNPDNIVYQAAVTFPDGQRSHDFFNAQANEWARCDDRRVDLHDPWDPNSHYWALSKTNYVDGVLTITRIEEDDPRWACQRGLTVANNVVADVSTCDYSDPNDPAVQIAKKIARNIENR